MPHRETVHIEVDKETIDKLEHGEQVDMMISGKITALESREVPDIDAEREEDSGPPPKKTIHEVGIEVESTKARQKTPFSDLVDTGEDGD